MNFDFHIHSTYSDGSSTLDEIFKKVKQKKGKAIAITDHDTILGLELADKLSKIYKVPFVSGVEFTVFEDNTKLHVLGYNININSEQIKKYSNEVLDYLNNKSKKQIKILNNKGYKISEEEFFKQAQGGPLYRAKLLRTLSDYGYIDQKEIMKSLDKFFNKDTGICYVKDEYSYSDFKTVCSMIKNNNGIVVLAHPYKIKKKNLTLYYKLLNNSMLDGIEVYHPSNDEKTRLELLKIAKDRNLIITGGTDYHGIYRKKYMPLMGMEIPNKVYLNMHKYLRNN